MKQEDWELLNHVLDLPDTKLDQLNLWDLFKGQANSLKLDKPELRLLMDSLKKVQATDVLDQLL
jgi:hypothetical protein